MRIGMFGGSFDPPHLGHIDDAVKAVKCLDLDLIIIMPCGMAPHKTNSKAVTAQQRLKLTRLSFENVPKCEISTLEMQREGPSYTRDTLKILKEKYPDDELFLIMGGDMLMSFSNWMNPEEIVSLAKLAVLPRNEKRNDLETEAEKIRKVFSADVTVIDNELIDISSTSLRRLLPYGCGFEYLSEKAASYIEENNLYDIPKLPLEGEKLRQWAFARLNEKRIPHVQGCIEEAAKLAGRWGEDIKDAETAALLHDMTKVLNVSEQLKLAQKYGIIANNAEFGNYKLIHPVTAAAVADKLLHMPEKICSAIRWHTTGKENMSLLEKIIYLADFIEPSRKKFEGLENLRKLSYENIDKALLLGFELSVRFIEESGEKINDRTIQAARWLMKNTPDIQDRERILR